MTDYRSLIAPFLNHWRKPSTTDDTIKKYTRYLTRSIDFLETGQHEPNEAYYSALEAHFLAGLAKSTTADRVSLTRKFFTWILEQQGDRQITMTDINKSIHNGDEEAVKSTFEQIGKASIPEQIQAPIEGEPVACPNVDATHQQAINPDDVMPPHEEASQGASKKQTGRPKKSDEGRSVKLSVYLTPTLDADLKDLARIQRLSTPDYIFRLIERERDRRADALATFRALEEY